MLPFSDYMPYDQYPIDMARAEIMFEMSASSEALKKKQGHISLPIAFQNQFGFSHQTFCQIAFGCSAALLSVSIQDLFKPHSSFLQTSYFDKSAVPKEHVLRFFKDMAISEEQLAEKVRSDPNSIGGDFTIFQNHPLVEIVPDNYACIDTGFLIDKAGRSLIWTLLTTMEKKVRGKILPFWGAVFEAYANSILLEGYQAGGRFVPEPKYTNGEVAFDACLVEDERLILFEHKSSTLRADSKYSGNVDQLKSDIHLKFVEGDDAGSKGVIQLAKNLTRFLNGEDIAGISSKTIKKVYPILVCLDKVVSVPFFGRYLSERFVAETSTQGSQQKIAPLLTSNISDIEALLGYLKAHRLSDIFDSFHQANQSLLGSISGIGVPLLNNEKPGKNEILAKFSDLTDKLEASLFPTQNNT